MRSGKMINSRNSFSNLVQIGIVVADLERTITNLYEIFGIGPFWTINWPHSDVENVERYYHGEIGNFSAKMAFAEVGGIELEIIQPLNGESIWSDFLEERGEGIHHIRFNVDDLASTIEYLNERGIGVLQHGSGLREETTWVYYDTQDILGFILETMNNLPGTSGKTPKIRNDDT